MSLDHQTSDAQTNANRANAQQSTGPRTDAGKAKSSRNAMKTGLTGQTVLLPTDGAAAYEIHIHSHFARYSPATDAENTLVQFIADTEWRLLRIPTLEAGIYAIGRLELAESFAEESDASRRAALIDTKILLTYDKQLRNLALQERRLRNQYQKDMAKLEQLQRDRLEKEAAERSTVIERLAKISANCKKRNVPFNPPDFGFEFSNAEYAQYNARNEAQYPLTEETLDFHAFLFHYRNQAAA